MTKLFVGSRYLRTVQTINITTETSLRAKLFRKTEENNSLFFIKFSEDRQCKKITLNLSLINQIYFNCVSGIKRQTTQRRSLWGLGDVTPPKGCGKNEKFEQK